MALLKNSIKDDEVISAKGGTPPSIFIHFSSSYLKGCADKGMSDNDMIREVEGVLIHELTHGYQFSPEGAGGYAQGTDFFGFIEGLADYVRYVKGFTRLERRTTGGDWKDGYNTSAFFIDWLHSKDINFVYKFNQSVKHINPWSWEAAIKEVLGKDSSVSNLWQEYQADLTSGKILEIDAKLKELRDQNNGGDGDRAENIKLSGKSE